MLLVGIQPEAWPVQFPSVIQVDERGQNMGVLFNHFAGITIEVVVVYSESLSQEVF